MACAVGSGSLREQVGCLKVLWTERQPSLCQFHSRGAINHMLSPTTQLLLGKQSRPPVPRELTYSHKVSGSQSDSLEGLCPLRWGSVHIY